MGVPDSVALKQAQTLINTNTFEDTGCFGSEPNTNGEAVGAAIDAMARRDPAQARQVFEKVMQQTSDADERCEVARGIAHSLTHDQLRGLAETPDGRKLLERASAELKSDLGDHRNEQAWTQIGNAIKAADLKSSAAFEALDPATRADVLARIGSPTARAAQADNLVALATSAGFQAAPPATRKELLSAQAENGKDSILSQGLQDLANDPAFKARPPSEQISAISAFSTAARSDAYRGREAFGLTRYADHYAPATSPSDADKRQILQNAQRVVTSAGFHDVGFDTRKAMMGTLNLHATERAFTGRLLDLVNSPGFLALNDAGKETKLLTAYGKDFALANGVDALVTDAEYTILAGTDRARVLTDIVKLAETKSYRDQDSDNRQAIVEVIGNVSARSVADPDNKAVRNALDQVIDGRVPLRFIYEKPGETASGDTALLFGKARQESFFFEGRVALNLDPATRKEADRYVRTLTHEVNHYLNGETEHGTADRFLDEYRAAVVGEEAANGSRVSLTADEQLEIVNRLTDGELDGYRKLHELYNSDPNFKAAIDDMKKTLTDGTTIDPEDARRRLLNAGSSSDYLRGPGNVDNH